VVARFESQNCLFEEMLYQAPYFLRRMGGVHNANLLAEIYLSILNHYNKLYALISQNKRTLNRDGV